MDRRRRTTLEGYLSQPVFPPGEDEEREDLAKVQWPLLPSEREDIDAIAKERGKSRQWVLRRLYEYDREHGGALPKHEEEEIIAARLPRPEVEALDKESESRGHSRAQALQLRIRRALAAHRRGVELAKSRKK